MVRNYVSSDLHRTIFPASRILDDNAAVHRFGLSAGGAYFSTGVGGVLTGRGGTLIIDDPQKGAEDAYSPIARKSLQTWFESVAYTRLEPGAAIVLVTTRWHTDDLAGWLLKEHATDNWQVVSLPAIAEPNDPLGRQEGDPLWPSRFPLEALDRIKTAIGSTAWSALYQQRPTPAEGAIFRKDWLRYYALPPSEFNRVIFSLDCAAKVGSSNDYSVLLVIGETQSGYFLLDVVRERLDFPALKSRTVAKAAYWRPHPVLIEDTSSGTPLIQTLRLETSLPLLPVKPIGDKESRASAVSPLFESGRVFLPQSAPWLADFIDELCSFPAAPHDDQVDGITQALTWLRGERREYSYIGVPRGDSHSYTTPATYDWRYPAGQGEGERERLEDMANASGVGFWRNAPGSRWWRQRGF